MIAASYPFLDVLWTMVIFFIWIMWFTLLFRVIADVFRRDDLSGRQDGLADLRDPSPFLGVFIYLITQNAGMTERNLDRARAQRAQFDDQVRAAAGAVARGEIEKAKQSLDSGAITQAEFDALKQKALG